MGRRTGNTLGLMKQETEQKTDGVHDKASEGVRAVERALDVLAAFSPGDNELLVADLLKRVGLTRPTPRTTRCFIRWRGCSSSPARRWPT